jgi:hypothetical protein
MKYKFTYSNLDIIKATYCGKPNQTLAENIINVLTKIDFDKKILKNSYIEIFENTKYGTGINFNLISNSSISLNINTNEDYIDFIVYDNITIYEMYKVKNTVDFLKDFKKWFESIITVSAYIKFGFIFVNKFEDSKGDILFKDINYLYSSHLNRRSYQKKYDAWIVS